MSDKLIAGFDSKIVTALREAGVLPLRCRSFTLQMQVDRVVTVTSTCFATEDEILAIAQALKDNPDEANRIAHEIAFTTPELERSVAVSL